MKLNHCFVQVSDSGISASSDLKGENNGSEFLHLVSSYDCCNSICGDFDCKMAKEARCKKTIPRKLNHHSHLFGHCRVVLNSDLKRKEL